MSRATIKLTEAKLAELTRGSNHDVYLDRLKSSDPKYQPFKKTPCSIYFYYIKFGEYGVPDIRHYEEFAATPFDYYTDMPDKIKELAKSARDETGEVKGTNFENITWDRKGYIVIFMDSPDWELMPTSNGGAVIFRPDKGSTPNHSFFDGMNIQVIMPPLGHGDDGRRTAIYFINHMKKSEFGDDLGIKQDGSKEVQFEYYAFDVCFQVKGQGGSLPTVFIIDPGGMNLGPPVPPP